jgi:hypothetical protein
VVEVETEVAPTDGAISGTGSSFHTVPAPQSENLDTALAGVSVRLGYSMPAAQSGEDAAWDRLSAVVQRLVARQLQRRGCPSADRPPDRSTDNIKGQAARILSISLPRSVQSLNADQYRHGGTGDVV